MKRFYTRKELGAELRARGFPISPSKLSKLCAPSVGLGPPVAAWLGPKALHELDAGIAWAESLLSPVRSALQPTAAKADSSQEITA